MEIPVEALAVADADPAVAPVAAAVSAEVSGQPGRVSLLDAVAAGRVPRPAEMPFSEWLKWRAGSGKRPTRGRDGVSTTMQQEAVLWKALMSAYYGEERAEALEEVGAERESRPSPALSELSGEPGVEELQAVLQSAYDPRKESLDVFEARVNRAAEGLLMLGIEVADRQEEVLLEASAVKEVYGATSSLDPAVMVRTARDFFVGISIDPHISDRSRLKTFQNIYRQEIRAGNVEADPASVYERIKSKHLLFSESVEEREIRVDSEHAALLKGKLTGHQFEPLFERSIAELEEIGLGKTPKELFLSYLRKVGPHLQKEIRKDKRIWPKEAELRAPRSWEEAHKVVLEYEQRESTNRAQVSSVYVAEETPRPRRQPKGGEDSVLNTDTGKGASRKSKICFHFPQVDKCEYSHDKELRKKALAELRARGDSVGATSDRGGKGGKGRGRGKGNGKGRDRSPSGGRTRRDSPRRRADSPDRGRDRSRGRGNKQGVLCPYFLKSGSCKKGSGCDMVHALVVTENQQNTQSQGAATSSDPAAIMSQAAQAAAQPPLLGLASAPCLPVWHFG